MVTICAHRGVSAEFPENTLAAFNRAIELGVDGIELDVHLASDGAVIVMHDETVDRTTNGTGTIADKTLEELRQLDAGGGQKVPTLHEVLALIDNRLHVNIEVKAAAAAMAVLQTTANFPEQRFAISSFDHDVLREIRGVSSTIDLWPLASYVSDELFETGRELGATQLNLWDQMLNRDIVTKCLEEGFGTWVWTVNDPDRARALVEWGAVGICTDDPARIGGF